LSSLVTALGRGAGSVQAIVADLAKASRQDVQEEATHEVVEGEHGDLAVPGDEADGAVVEGDQAGVGDGDPVGVAAEVL